MTKYNLEFLVSIDIDIDPAVFAEVTDEWRSVFYDLQDDEEVAEHVARNVFMGRGLSRLDGWAGMSDSLATVFDENWSLLNISSTVAP